MKNKLYESCEKFIGRLLNKDDNTISIKFGISFPINRGEIKEVRREDVNNLYFNLVESVTPRELIEDLYDLRSYIRSVDKDGLHREKIESILDALYNGNEYKRK